VQETLGMPNDAKLGLVVGVGLVISIAVVFFQKEPEGVPPGQPASVVARPPVPPLVGAAPSAPKSAKNKTTSWTGEDKATQQPDGRNPEDE
jgi:hypothetical protein